MTVLDKCPFCHGDAEIVLKYDYLYTVQCQKCKCGTQHMTKELAVKVWNTRPDFDYWKLPSLDNIGKRIKYFRKFEKEISLKKMSEQIDESWTVISAWEHGNAEPSIDNIVKLSEYFGCTTDFLLKGVKGS